MVVNGTCNVLMQFGLGFARTGTGLRPGVCRPWVRQQSKRWVL